MSEPLSLEHFQKFEKHFDDFVELYVKNHTDVVRRLGSIEAMLWQGERIAQISERLIKLAEATGHDELAHSFIPPLGKAEPVQS